MGATSFRQTVVLGDRTPSVAFPIAPYLSLPGALLALLAAIVLCWPMLLVSAPLIYFDSLSYFSNGEEIWSRVLEPLWQVPAPATLDPAGVDPSAAGVGAVAAVRSDLASVSFRSLPYSAFFYPASLTPLGMVLACILQTAVTLWTFLALVPALDADGRKRALLGFAAVAAFSTLPWFASYAMPDLLGAVLPVYFALLLARFDALGPMQRIALFAVTCFAILSHYGHLPLAAILAVAVIAWRLFRRRLTGRVIAYAVLPVAIAVVINLGTSVALGAVASRMAEKAAAEQAVLAPPTASAAPASASAPGDAAATGDQTQPGGGGSGDPGVSVTPNRLPVLLARSLEDGPARWYLQEECPKGKPYAICEVFDEIPDSVWVMLWTDRGLKGATPEQRARIKAEETDIVVAAAMRYPAQQIWALTYNTLKQSVMVGTGEVLPASESSGDDIHDLAPNTKRNMESPVLTLFDWVTPLFTLACFLVLAWRIVTGRTQGWLTEICVMVVVALLANAAIYGGLSAPADRYQSRLAWLIPALLALDLAIGSWRGRPAREAASVA